MQTTIELIRHGDLVFHPLDPCGVDTLKALPRGTPLAQGTATGHSHTLTDAAAATLYDLPEGENGRLLVVEREVGVAHEEHKTVTLAPGYYRVTIKRQYDAALGQRAVED